MAAQPKQRLSQIETLRYTNAVPFLAILLFTTNLVVVVEAKNE